MIRRITTVDLMELVQENEKKRKDLQNKAKEIENSLKKNSKEYNDAIQKLKSQLPPKYYLEEDCSGFKGGGLKRNVELQKEEIKKLYDLGYHILWINDGKRNTEDKAYNEWDGFFYEKKQEIDDIIGRSLHFFDEKDLRKPNSTIKLCEGDDLTRHTINPLQEDGARIVFRELFEEKAKRLFPLVSHIKAIRKKNLKYVGIYDNVCTGNLFKATDSEQAKHSEPTNFFLKSTVSTGLAFCITLNHIQTKRVGEENDDPDRIHNIDLTKRNPLLHEQLMEVELASFFCDIGFIHIIIEKTIERETAELIDINGKMVAPGYVVLKDRVKSLFDRHCNVSKHLIASSRKPQIVKELGKDILQYHHQSLHGGGYPKRKSSDERLQETDEFGNATTILKNKFEYPMPETTRLASICNSFCEYLLGNTYRLPFERDSLVRYFKLNSVYKTNLDGTIDKDIENDIDTREKYKKRFDGYLVDEFFSRIRIYKINEEIPLMKFSEPNKIQYKAVVSGFTDVPNRLLIKITKDGIEQIINLNHNEWEEYFIGEYVPCLKFKLVQDYVAPEYSNIGVTILEDLYISDITEEDIKKIEQDEASRREKMSQLEHMFQIEDDSLPDINENEVDVDSLIAQYSQMPGNKEKPKREPLYKKEEKDVVNIDEINESIENLNLDDLDDTINYMENNTDEEEIDLMKYSNGDYILINYVEELDPKKYPTPPNDAEFAEGVAKYIVQVKNFKDNERHIVTFVRFIKDINEPVTGFLKDKNCGKDFDLEKFPFFKPTRMLTAREIVEYLGIKLF